MKRCPQCHRTETDDSLAFCRADGTALISESGAVGADSGTVKFGAAPAVNETETSILPHRTDADMSRPTAPTTVLPPPSLQQGANFAAVYMYAGQFDLALDQAKKTYDLDPNFLAGC